MRGNPGQPPLIPQELLCALLRGVRHCFPELRAWLDALSDGRARRRCRYPLRALIWLGVQLFAFQLGARRRLRFDLNSAFGLSNLNILAETNLQTLPHSDTLNYSLKKLPARELRGLRAKMVRKLVRSRVLERFRLLGRFYLVAVDGTGFLTFSERHCPHCLSRKLSNGSVQYYHPVLEAKLICANGLAISIATEFIQNTDGSEKQDCEQKAFARLLPKLRLDFPHLRLCLLMDGLYLNQTIMSLLRDHHCAWIITFKEGSLPESWREWQALWAMTPRQEKLVCDANRSRRYRWVNHLQHAGHTFDAFECRETSESGESTRFVWATSFSVSAGNVEDLSEKGGRCRWKIENEGFNIQKNRGYGLEHAYSEDWNAAQNFYLLLQIAHLFVQLLVKGLLRHTPVAKIFGSMAAFAARLLEAWRTVTLEPDILHCIRTERCQIRFDDS